MASWACATGLIAIHSTNAPIAEYHLRGVTFASQPDGMAVSPSPISWSELPPGIHGEASTQFAALRRRAELGMLLVQQIEAGNRHFEARGYVPAEACIQFEIAGHLGVGQFA